METIPVGTICRTGSDSTTLRTDGPIVAFYGLIHGTGSQSCIARLGGYRLLQSSELNSECMCSRL